MWASAWIGDADAGDLCSTRGGRVPTATRFNGLFAGALAEEGGGLKGGTLAATVMSNLGLERYLADRGVGLHPHARGRTANGGRGEANPRPEPRGRGSRAIIVMTDYAKLPATGLIAGLPVPGRDGGRTGKPASRLARSFQTLPSGAAQRALTVRGQAALEPARRAGGDPPAGEAKLKRAGASFDPQVGEPKPLIRVMAEAEDEALNGSAVVEGDSSGAVRGGGSEPRAIFWKIARRGGARWARRSLRIFVRKSGGGGLCPRAFGRPPELYLAKM